MIADRKRRSIPKEVAGELYELGYTRAINDLFDCIESNNIDGFYKIIDGYYGGVKDGEKYKIRPEDLEQFNKIREKHYAGFDEKERERFCKQEAEREKKRERSLSYAEKSNMGRDVKNLCRISI